MTQATLRIVCGICGFPFRVRSSTFWSLSLNSALSESAGSGVVRLVCLDLAVCAAIIATNMAKKYTVLETWIVNTTKPVESNSAEQTFDRMERQAAKAAGHRRAD